MRRIAIFVEGQTEQAFVELAIRHIIGSRKLVVETVKLTGGKDGGIRKISQITAAEHCSGTEYYALIYDCGCDNRVMSDIVEKYPSLESLGYDHIIGMRDLYPLDRSQEGLVAEAMKKVTPTGSVKVTVILVVMEIEAWFIAEYGHFSSINNKLTCEQLITLLGYDPSTQIVEDIAHPSEDLKTVYMSVGTTYNKSKAKVERTVQILDYALIYLEISNRVPALGVAMGAFTDFYNIGTVQDNQNG